MMEARARYSHFSIISPPPNNHGIALNLPSLTFSSQVDPYQNNPSLPKQVKNSIFFRNNVNNCIKVNNCQSVSR